MTSEDFDALVERIQQRYGSRPFALRMRIALLVALGYAGFLAVLLLVLVISGLLFMGAAAVGREPGIFLVAMVAVLLAFGISHALVFLWVPMQPQDGCEVTRDQVPRLFDLLDLLQHRLRAPRFHHVRITADFNASVQMIPRLGVFGLNRSYLFLGLPLMCALTTDQFTAVLAHELAHSSSRHDRFSVWIYRLRQTWSRLFAELHAQNATGLSRWWRGPIVAFVDWYWPRFHAWAFVLSRADEYEADRLAAECAGAACTAEALFRLECLSRRLGDKFWDELTLQARAEAEVADNFLERLVGFLDTHPDPADASRWIDQSFQALTGTADTHPSLSDRLKSLGPGVSVVSGFPPVPRPSAAETLLEPSLHEITGDVNRQWRKENSLRWQNIYHQARRLERQLESVAAPVVETTDPTDGDVDQAWQHARLVCDLQGPAAAEPLLRQVLDRQPSHALANVTLGRHLLDHGNPEGEVLLRRVVDEEDNELIPVACQGLIAYFQQQGQLDRLREAKAVLSRFETSQAEAARERATVTAADRFLPHELERRDLERLQKQLGDVSELANAWLVRKDVQYFRRKPLFVLVVQSRTTGLLVRSDAATDQQLVARLIGQIPLPGRVLVIAPQGGFRGLASKVIAFPASRIYPTALADGPRS